MNIERWAFTAAEIANQGRGTRRTDHLFAVVTGAPDLVVVQRNGKASNQYADGGTADPEARDLAEIGERFYSDPGPDRLPANHWRYVLVNTDGSLEKLLPADTLLTYEVRYTATFVGKIHTTAEQRPDDVAADIEIPEGPGGEYVSDTFVVDSITQVGPDRPITL